jgi:hypothetical protein
MNVLTTTEKQQLRAMLDRVGALADGKWGIE